MKLYERGSEWRKWDLHVHAPGGTMEDRYLDKDLDTLGKLDRFCRILFESDVEVFGITDYFSVSNYFRVTTRFTELYGETDKVFFPNLELRLVEAVSKKLANINLHLIFDPRLSEAKITKFLSRLKTTTEDDDETSLTCDELEINQFDSASVYLDDVKKALEETFGPGNSWKNLVFPIMPAGNDGIRPDVASSGALRKKNLAKRFDKFTTGIFGNNGDVGYYLNTAVGSTRGDDLPPRPVFAGCDAHSYEDLEKWLGREIRGDCHKNVTWVKADPTFEGLTQTAIEPADRVRIQANRPDLKQPYHVITSVAFPNSVTFPAEIKLNPNLVSIIGSRSSGKSSLLAHIAHAVDPAYTMRQQLDTGLFEGIDETGPAAGKTWKKEAGQCEVLWGDSAETRGQVVYIPQNSLFKLNDRHSEITAKIAPILFRADKEFETAHQQTETELEEIKRKIKISVEQWFAKSDNVDLLAARRDSVGDVTAIKARKESLSSELDKQRRESPLNEGEILAYQAVMETLAEFKSQTNGLLADRQNLSRFFSTSSGTSTVPVPEFSVSITLSPSVGTLSQAVQDDIEALISQSRSDLQSSVRQVLTKRREEIEDQISRISGDSARLQQENGPLIERNKANAVLEELVRQIGEQTSAISLWEKHEADLIQALETRDDSLNELISLLRSRVVLIEEHGGYFESGPILVDDISLGIEVGYNLEDMSSVSQDFDLRSATNFVERNVGIKLEQILLDPASFLTAIRIGEQKVKQGRSPLEAAIRVLTYTPDFHFFAELEEDRIGGVEPSSMTPGKQAMFALKLILNESDEPWPLLIDQPEDDLDSRSIYEHIVPYLSRRKVDRQIIMVTHNANLVIGADSEQVIVANRHGSDSRNSGSRTFDYLSGSLEHTAPRVKHSQKLKTCGIREHSCEILDGGSEAFRKRQDKYRV